MDLDQHLTDRWHRVGRVLVDEALDAHRLVNAQRLHRPLLPLRHRDGSLAPHRHDTSTPRNVTTLAQQATQGRATQGNRS
jgi:hypothetical protein